MLERFLAFIKTHHLFKKEDTVLLTVSGGIDSIVLAHLFHKAGFSFGIAHCNFNLRGKASDEDEAFVKKIADAYDAAFHSKHFDTNEYAVKHQLSTQMAARELRYVWFKDLMNEFGYDSIATAHHQNDVVETILLNLTKGTGIAGLHGIRKKNGHVIRPLLFTDKTAIEAYAKAEGLKWREDASNEKGLPYERNHIRHEVVPALKAINPNLASSFERTTEKLSAAEELLKEYLGVLKTRIVTQKGNTLHFSIEALKHTTENQFVLFELIKEHGFTYDDCREIIKSLDGTPGKMFPGHNCSLNKDRDNLILSFGSESNLSSVFIQSEDNEVTIDGQLLYIQKMSSDKVSINADPNIALIDYNKLSFPLEVRKWQQGDRFQPLGMKQSKKISDFLINEKVPLSKKDKINLLVSNNEIVWVMGMRINEKFKVTEKTKVVLDIRIKKV